MNKMIDIDEKVNDIENGTDSIDVKIKRLKSLFSEMMKTGYSMLDEKTRAKFKKRIVFEGTTISFHDIEDKEAFVIVRMIRDNIRKTYYSSEPFWEASFSVYGTGKNLIKFRCFDNYISTKIKKHTTAKKLIESTWVKKMLEKYLPNPEDYALGYESAARAHVSFEHGAGSSLFILNPHFSGQFKEMRLNGTISVKLVFIKRKLLTDDVEVDEETGIKYASYRWMIRNWLRNRKTFLKYSDDPQDLKCAMAGELHLFPKPLKRDILSGKIR